MRVLILCAGQGDRWANYLGMPKQLAPIDNGPLLCRTVSALRKFSVMDIIVIAPLDDTSLFAIADAPVQPAKLNPALREIDRFVSSRHLWSTRDRTLILYGDVVWTDAALRTVVYDQYLDWRTYGRPHASRYTGCPWGELFAWSWSPKDHDLIDREISRVIRLQQNGTIDRSIGWELYRALCGVPDEKIGNASLIPKTSNFTDDIDTPEEFERLVRRAGYLRGFSL